ncbi:hypothetical protein RIR_jg38507.t2 [Rhizophagus irregularis DAOM 181602=DAOM 197198]|nr:hypothetical protein RIR_jg38507.t1 [Rhizophagus irregularis DAOM 181602=DAOM 197198]GET65930.1 hypothetical protein RIR_jg38507.t2 [Rhizophagus irregularis DAOM 181602=DAOM 197198]
MTSWYNILCQNILTIITLSLFKMRVGHQFSNYVVIANFPNHVKIQKLKIAIIKPQQKLSDSVSFEYPRLRVSKLPTVRRKICIFLSKL